MSVLVRSHFFSSFGSRSIFSFIFLIGILKKVIVNKLKTIKKKNYKQWGQWITNFDLKQQKNI